MKTNSGIEISTSLLITLKAACTIRSSVFGGVAVVGEPREDHAHAHQRERGGEAQHDRHHDQRQHQQAEMAVRDGVGAREHDRDAEQDQPHQNEAEPEFLAHSHARSFRAPEAPSAPCPRGGVVALGRPGGSFGTATYLSSCAMSSSFTCTIAFSLSTSTSSTSSMRDGHAPDRMHRMQRTISTMPWSSSHAAGDRNDELERVQRQWRGGESLLADRECLHRVGPAGPGERDDAGQKEQHVEDEVDPRLRARREEAVEDVAAHVAVLGQRVGAGHHEQRAVQHDLRRRGPSRAAGSARSARTPPS
jgi:hypothetical protein